MKKALVIITCLIIGFAFSACGSTPYYGADDDKAYEVDVDNQAYESEHNDDYYEGYEDGRDSAYEDYYIEDYDWMVNNVVFTTASEDYYHKVYCEEIAECDIWVDFIEGAESDGYDPCPRCCTEEPRIEKD